MSNEKFFDFQRRHERKNYKTEVSFVYNDRLYRGTISNISLGGAFIIVSCVNLFSVGDIINVSIPFPNGRKNIKRKAEVRWMNNEGIAVEFLFAPAE